MLEYNLQTTLEEGLKKFYVGSTNNLEDRLYRHNSGQGNFTSKGIPWKLIYGFDCADRKEAIKLETKIKKRGISRFLIDQNIKFGK